MESQLIQRRPLPVLLLPLWWLLHFAMFLAAICGLALVALALISFAVDLSEGFWDLRLGGNPVRTTAQKALFVFVGAAVGLLGGGFFWLRRRGYRKGAVLFFAVTLGLFLLLGWTTGIGSVSAGPFEASWWGKR